MMRNLLLVVIAVSVLCGASPTSQAQKSKKKAAATAPAPAATPATPATKKQARTFDFGAMSFEGTMRTPQLLYFLGRVKQELDRAALEKRSFMPELARTVDQGGL